MAGDPVLGAALRKARKAEGLTLKQVADAIGCTPGHVSLMECGKRTIYPDVPLAYEKASREAGVNRRGLLAGLSATALAPQAAAVIIRHGFNAALGPRPDPDEWTARLEDYGRAYMMSGASVVQNELTADLVMLPASIETPHMWATTAKALAIYGKTTKGPREAIEWYNTALEAADRSGDVGAEVWTAGRAALALGYEGAEPLTALGYARRAVDLSDKPTPGRLNALMGAAHVHAKFGREAEAREAWTEVLRCYDALAPGDDITDFNYPYWRLCVVGSLLFARLGDVAEAERWQADCDRHRPADMHRFATHIELHRGLMLARDGDHEGGISYATTALNALPADKRSQSLTLMLDEIKQG